MTGGYIAGGLQARRGVDDALVGPFLVRVLRLDRHGHGGGGVVVSPRDRGVPVQRRRRVQGAGLARRQNERALEPHQTPIAVGYRDVAFAVRVTEFER